MHLARSLQADPPRIPAASTRDTGKPGPSRRMRDRARGAAGRFARNEDGAIVFFAVFVFLMMLIVAGIGIDVMRYERDRANMQYTLDRAVLAASSLGQRQDPETVVRDYLSLAGLIDKDAEIERLSKEIDKLRKEVGRAEVKLKNPKFVDKAPQAVVDKEKAKLDDYRSQLAKLEEQLEKIKYL